MDPAGELDWTALADLIEWHVEQGTEGLVAVGTTGESPTLSIDEHIEVVRRIVELAAGRIPVIAGTGTNSANESLELTEAAKAAGAAAALLVVPYYNKPTQEGMYRHFRYIAERVELPQLLYNVPSRTVVDLLPATVARLAQVPNIVGIKEATGNMARLQEIQAQVPDEFILLSGDDGSALKFLELGGHGAISVTANVMPALYAELCRAARAGDWPAARAADAKLQLLNEVLFLESNPIPVKWALEAMGRIQGGIRLPLTPLSAELQPRVGQVLQQLGLLEPAPRASL